MKGQLFKHLQKSTEEYLYDFWIRNDFLKKDTKTINYNRKDDKYNNVKILKPPLIQQYR